ncbi:MAG: LysR family transcriptional regulator substrate-binding protein, partial [Caenibius sp.]
LLFRHSNGVTLTDAGVRLYAHATDILDRMKLLTDEMSANLGKPHGAVALGVPQSMQSVITAPVVAAFHQEFPDVALNVIVNSSAHLRDAIIEGQIDLAIISTLTPSRGLNYTPLFADGMYLVEQADSPRQFKSVIDTEDLAGQSLILCGYPNTVRPYFEEQFNSVPTPPIFKCEVTTASLVIDLVRAGAGAGLVPGCAVAMLPADEIRATPIRGLEVCWNIATSYERIGSAAVMQLSEMMRLRVAEMVEKNAWPTARMLVEDMPADEGKAKISA